MKKIKIGRLVYLAQLLLFAYIIYISFNKLYTMHYDRKMAIDGSKEYFENEKAIALEIYKLCRTPVGREKAVDYFCTYGAENPNWCVDNARDGYGLVICHNVAEALNEL